MEIFIYIIIGIIACAVLGVTMILSCYFCKCGYCCWDGVTSPGRGGVGSVGVKYAGGTNGTTDAYSGNGFVSIGGFLGGCDTGGGDASSGFSGGCDSGGGGTSGCDGGGGGGCDGGGCS